MFQTVSCFLIYAESFPSEVTTTRSLTVAANQNDLSQKLFNIWQTVECTICEICENHNHNHSIPPCKDDATL